MNWELICLSDASSGLCTLVGIESEKYLGTRDDDSDLDDLLTLGFFPKV